MRDYKLCYAIEQDGDLESFSFETKPQRAFSDKGMYKLSE